MTRPYRIEIQTGDALTGLVGTSIQEAMDLATMTVKRTPVPEKARIRIIDEVHNTKVLDLIVVKGEWAPF